jgi:RNA polymerase sigma factor (sigma-70 family)
MAVAERSQAAMEAVDDLYRRYGGNVYRYALAVLGNHADAEDITQTTFLNAYRSLEQGVRPRKPVNWLLTIASNAIKQRFRQESTRPSHVQLDERVADASHEEDGPTVGELLTALARIPPQQRKALVLREFEGRSYREIAEILDVSTSALETLLFRARRSLADELVQHLTCTDAQLAISRAADGRLGRKEKRRLREHLVECADCAHFARLQRTHRHALKGLALVPVPVSLALFKGLEGTATAAAVPVATGVGAASVASSGVGIGAATVAASGTGLGAGAAGGGVVAGGFAVKAAAVVAAAGVAGGVGVVGASEVDTVPVKTKQAPPATQQSAPGKRLGQTAPRGVTVPGNGVAVGNAKAPGQTKAPRTNASGVGQQRTRATGQSAAQARTAPTGQARGRTGTQLRGPSTQKPDRAGAQGLGRTTPKPPAQNARKPEAEQTTQARPQARSGQSGQAKVKAKGNARGTP